MEKKDFNLEEARKIFSDEECYDKKGNLKDPVNTKAYISKYFYSTTHGDHFFWDASKKQFIVYNKQNVKDVYFDRMNKEISLWYFKQNTKIYRVVNIVNEPRIKDNKLNMWGGWKHNNVKKFKSYSVETRKRVQMFLDFIKDVLGNGNNDQYEYIMKWLANVAKGKKNDTCLYLRGEEGLGKSTLTDFFTEFVFGEQTSLTLNDVDVLLTSNNAILNGINFVVFEEMPTFSEGQWNVCSGKLKFIVTNPITKDFVYCDKYEKKYKASNCNNFIICTNVDAIKHSEGRRIYIADISYKYRKDHKFFGALKKECFNDTVGEAMFSYLLEYDTKDFNAQRDMPDTQGKLDALADRLDIVYKFLKEEYILKKTGLNHLLSDLYTEYVEYCKINDKKVLSKTKFNRKLNEVGINSKKSNGHIKFKVTIDDLNTLAEKNKWIHELDEFEDKEEELKSELSIDPAKLPKPELLEHNDELRKKLIEYEKLYKETFDKLILEEKKPKKKVTCLFNPKKKPDSEKPVSDLILEQYDKVCEEFEKLKKRKK